MRTYAAILAMVLFFASPAVIAGADDLAGDRGVPLEAAVETDSATVLVAEVPRPRTTCPGRVGHVIPGIPWSTMKFRPAALKRRP